MLIRCTITLRFLCLSFDIDICIAKKTFCEGLSGSDAWIPGPEMKPSGNFYRLHSPKCFKCGKPICPEPGEKEALRIIAMDKSFHKACFVCEVNFVRSKSKSTLTWSCYSVTFDMSSVQYNLFNSF